MTDPLIWNLQNTTRRSLVKNVNEENPYYFRSTSTQRILKLRDVHINLLHNRLNVTDTMCREYVNEGTEGGKSRKN